MTAIYFYLHLAENKSKKQSENIVTNFFIDDGGYSAWGGWSQCSVTCGVGRQSRSRTCTNPAPSPGGKDCSQLGLEKENRNCTNGGCPGNYCGNDE